MQIQTLGGLSLEISQENLDYHQGISEVIDKLNDHRGAVFTSKFEFPGRYTCWDIGFYNPPLVIICRSKHLILEALNERGVVLLAIILKLIPQFEHSRLVLQEPNRIELEVIAGDEIFSEEERSRQPSVFTILRQLLALFKLKDEPYLGFYGAFGYDLIYQFEELEKIRERDGQQRDMVLYCPDEIYVVDHRKEVAFIRRYDFQWADLRTHQIKREGLRSVSQARASLKHHADHQPGAYAEKVKLAKERFACGDLFEVVLSQTFFREYQDKPSKLFRKICDSNPSPYGFFINLGEEEYLIGASPEMYVRLQGSRVETSPISGTIRRGANAIEDAVNIQALLMSEKETSELTMCTDVDRNDKSRICEAGSVTVLGRRMIEMYSRLIHTVDHVIGTLRPGFDAIDAFLTHMWVVTVTGAPKLWAMRFIEQNEESPRRWYGGAVGWFGFDGNLNTGLVLRTIRLQQGIAELRAGATLLFDSDPQAEEEETRLKASAFLDLLEGKSRAVEKTKAVIRPGLNKKVLLLDHQDSFVHTLANYLRQTGAEVQTIRYQHLQSCLKTGNFDLVVLSPGPGRPEDFNLKQSIDLIRQRKIPIFGVCLGLQGIVEYFGGRLAQLDYPVHGKPAEIRVIAKTPLFSDLGSSFIAGRYHSLYAERATFPDQLEITAESGDGIIMAVRHRQEPIEAVQFHPETILSLPDEAGIKIMNNLIRVLSGAAS